MKHKWQSNWIESTVTTEEEAPIFKKEFEVSEKIGEIKKAEIYICGLGFYYFKFNGKRISKDILQPAFSNYDKTVYYNVYDITENLLEAKNTQNTIEVVLGNGWYNEFPKTVWKFEQSEWRRPPRLRCEIYINDKLAVKTDTSWVCGKSNITFNSLRCGETYNATNSIEDEDFKPVKLAIAPGGELKEQKINPIRVQGVVKPVNIIRNSQKDFVYDYGTNLSGDVEIAVKAPKGTEISIQYFERLMDGHMENLMPIYCQVLERRFQKDVYIANGDGTEVWHGEFRYHGFRYIRITANSPIEVVSADARVIHTDINDMGGIETDDVIINKIQKAIRQSTLANLHHMPTDCPHREKVGWAADGWLSSGQALYNFDMVDIYEKWLDDFVDCQKPSGQIPCYAPTPALAGYDWGSGPCWDLVLFVIPWRMYMFTGDKKYLERYFEPMKKYLNYAESITENGLCSLGLDEWCAVKTTGDEMPPEAVITMALYTMYIIFKKAAKILNQTDDEAYAADEIKVIRSAYMNKYGDLHLKNQLYLAGNILFNLTDNPKETADELAKLVEEMDYHLYGGIFTTATLFDVLTNIGRFDLAYKIAEQTDFPGYSHMIDICGGTLGEEFYGGGSYNHHMFSAIGEWFYSGIAGIKLDEDNPGFKHICIEPNIPQEMKKFKAWHMTPFGKIEVKFDKDKIYIELPSGITADFKYGNISENLSAGTYVFKR